MSLLLNHGLKQLTTSVPRCLCRFASTDPSPSTTRRKIEQKLRAKRIKHMADANASEDGASPSERVKSTTARRRATREVAQPDDFETRNIGLRIESSGQRGQWFGVLQGMGKLRARGRKTTRTQYLALLRALAVDEDENAQDWAEHAMEVLEDMRQNGLSPDVACYNMVLRIMAQSGVDPEPLFARMQAEGIRATNITYQHRIAFCREIDDLEFAMALFKEMREKHKLEPTLQIIETLILMAARLQEPALACDLIRQADTESNRMLQPATLIEALSYFLDDYDYRGVRCVWWRLEPQHTSLSEGILIQLLDFGARLGLQTYSKQALHFLRLRQVPLQEFHLNAIVEAHARSARLIKATNTVSRLAKGGVEPTATTTGIFVRELLRKPAEANADTQDLAEAETTPEDHVEAEQPEQPVARTQQMEPSQRIRVFLLALRVNYEKYGMAIHPAVFNACLEAVVRTDPHDRKRLAQVFDARTQLGVPPNVSTYNAMLRICTSDEHKATALGERARIEMEMQGVEPDAETYDYLAKLALMVQSPYEAESQVAERSLRLLADLRDKQIEPSEKTWNEVALELCQQDHPLFQPLLDEMRQRNVTFSRALKRAMEFGRVPKETLYTDADAQF